MSTPNPTHIIAEGMREIATTGAREDGQLWGAFPNTMTVTDLAEHVVSKLTDAGYSIMPSEWLTKPQGSRVGEKVTVSLRGGEPFNGMIIEENPGGQRSQRFLVEDEDGFKLWANHSVITSAAAEGEKP